MNRYVVTITQANNAGTRDLTFLADSMNEDGDWDGRPALVFMRNDTVVGRVLLSQALAWYLLKPDA